MVHLSKGLKDPVSPALLSEPAIIAGMAAATLPDSKTPWDGTSRTTTASATTMAQVLDGFEDFNRRVRRDARLPHPPARARARVPHRVRPRSSSPRRRCRRSLRPAAS